MFFIVFIIKLFLKHNLIIAFSSDNDSGVLATVVLYFD